MQELIFKEEKMTSLQIAEITGKNHKDLMRDIRKMEESWVEIGQRKFALSSYLTSQNKEMPMFVLTKTECLYIATKFNDVARAKLIIRWQELEQAEQDMLKNLSPAEQLLRSVQLTVENERKLKNQEKRIKVLEAKTKTRPEYFTIAGYATLNGISVNLKLAASLGRKASAQCKRENLMMDETKDPRFGKVRMYPASVLEQVFETAFVS